MKEEGFISNFFFIKYYDPDFHLRFRLFNTDKISDSVIQQINQLIEKKLGNKIFRICYDTYDRELERYNDNEIVIFEKIFYFDSLISGEIISKNFDDSDAKWIDSIAHIIFYYTVFEMDLKSQIEFTKKMKNSFSNEFGSSPTKTSYINKKYKIYYEDLIKNSIEVNGQLEKSKLFSALLNKEDLEKLCKTENALKNLSNIVHMHIIRVVRNNNRLHEYLMYCFLEKLLNEKFHKNKKTNDLRSHF